jgi:hypothetical protein
MECSTPQRTPRNENPYQPPLAEQGTSAAFQGFRFVGVMVFGVGIAAANLAAIAFVTRLIVPG